MNKNMVLVVVVALLVIVSGVQAFQLTTLKDKIDNGKVKLGGSSSVSSSSSGSASVSGNSLDNLPQMVGGC